MQPIKKIELKYFRGASLPITIEFKPKKNTVVIFGENGRGKSTIVDAIDMVANLCSGSLDSRSSTNPKKHVPSIGNSHKNVSVSLATKEQTWLATLNNSKISVSGPDNRPIVHILRRSQLLTLIQSQPAERYKALQKFIDVSFVEKAEQSLRDAIKTASLELMTLTQQLVNAKNELEKLWKEEGRIGKSALKWAKEKASADQNDLEKQVSYLKNALENFENVLLTKENFRSSSTDHKTKLQVYEGVVKEIEEMPELNGKEAIELLGILQQTQEYMSGPEKSLAKCPVCEQTIEHDELVKDIDVRISKMTVLQQLDNKKTSAQQNVDSSKSNAVNDLKRYFAAVTVFVDEIQKNCAAQFKELGVDWDGYSVIKNTKVKNKDKLQLCDTLCNVIDPNLVEIKAKHGELQKDLNQHNVISTYFDSLQKNTDAATQLKTMLAHLEKSLEIAHSKRVEYTQGILNEVTEECNRLYRKIHPGESLGGSVLTLDPVKRSSLHQSAEFEGHKDVPPQAYFSDSHLDTLGFCVWLAIAKRDSPKDNIIVLDDVFNSADAVHLRRIVELLTEEADNFCQVIITTHYRNWRDRYRLMQSASGKVDLIELHKWSLGKGIRTYNSKLAVEELEDTIAREPFDRESVANRGGVLLESVTDTLALQYGCKTRHTRENDYALKELLDSCAKLFGKMKIHKALQLVNAPLSPEQVKAAKEDEVTIMLPLDTFLKIQDSVFVRNQVGCHYNLSGMSISDDEVEEFGKDVVALVKAITCQNCKMLPSKPKGTHFECSCGLVKLEPLKL